MPNTALQFDRGLVEMVRVDRSAAEARIASLWGRRTFKMDAQVAALLRAVRCLDLTTLAGDDTDDRVARLCAKALMPVRRDILTGLRVTQSVTVGAVCVYPALVPEAVERLAGRLPVASVATGFPAGQTPLPTKLAEITWAIEHGATEIDVVISRGLVLTGLWYELHEEIREFRVVCGDRAKMKVILGVGNLGTLTNVAKAAVVAILAGADTVKTSTGFEPTNATFEAGLAMLRIIRWFATEIDPERVVGFKPAGGIQTAADVMRWLILVLEELGERWTHPDRLRIGASRVLLDLERQLFHNWTGAYAASHELPMA